MALRSDPGANADEAPEDGRPRNRRIRPPGGTFGPVAPCLSRPVDPFPLARWRNPAEEPYVPTFFRRRNSGGTGPLALGKDKGQPYRRWQNATTRSATHDHEEAGMDTDLEDRIADKAVAEQRREIAVTTSSRSAPGHPPS